MSKEQYLRMCEQMKQEPDWDKCPDDWEDFPNIIVEAVNIYHSMGDRIYGDVGYVGKDFTNLNLLFDLYKIKTNIEKDWILEIILFLDARQIKESQASIKAELERIKSKK